MTKRRVTFDQVNVVVHDMDASVAFYRRLGLEIGGDGQPWAHQHRSAEVGPGLDFDLDSVEFAERWSEDWRGA
jgi:catechol 2,3-dioxygenase-like lactoylglutathione lyase family enzyme